MQVSGKLLAVAGEIQTIRIFGENETRILRNQQGGNYPLIFVERGEPDAGLGERLLNSLHGRVLLVDDVRHYVVWYVPAARDRKVRRDIGQQVRYLVRDI